MDYEHLLAVLITVIAVTLIVVTHGEHDLIGVIVSAYLGYLFGRNKNGPCK